MQRFVLIFGHESEYLVIDWIISKSYCIMNCAARHYLIVVFTSFVYCSCTKSTNSPSLLTGPNNGATIYVAGSNGTNPVLWKNGVATILSSSSGSADQVFVSGTDVFVSGTSEVSTSSFLTPAGPIGDYVYWKNGAQNKISGPDFLESSISIAVAGNDLFYSISNLWENGKMIALEGQGTGRVNAILTAGSDIYAAGSDSVGDAAYWKNGKLTVVAQGYYPNNNSGSDPTAFCLYVSGNDVYIGGNNINNLAAYWKNGVATVLHTKVIGSFATSVGSIFVSGNDVYTSAPLVSTGGSNLPAYWKNGIEYDLPLDGDAYGYSTSVFVSGADIYVTGYTSSSGAVYWKNGIKTILSPSGSANSIYIQ